jgi:Xaa-Pro aminopeptidase
VLTAAGTAALVVPELEKALASGAPVAPWPEGADPYALVRAVFDAAPARVGVADRMWAQHLLGLRAALGDVETVLASSVLRELRMRKSPAEVEALRRAAHGIDRVHARIGEWLMPGRTEREVARDISAAILAEGHTEVSFVIVGSGPNGASPHHQVSDRTIWDGEPIVVDIGGVTADGYCSDSTRTYCIGEPPAQFRAYYEVLREAQAAGCAAVRPGVSAGAVDAACREPITRAGYGEFFIHRTGHGIGLDGHEEPYITAGSTEVLEPGMAFSVEPGIYLPGRHGARIEDIVVCTEDGVDVLNSSPRELVIL